MSHPGNTPAFVLPRSHRRRQSRRRGATTLWVIVSIPVFLILLCFVIEIGNLWLARIELENAVEASALATVQTWKSTTDTSLARIRGREIGLANCVRGTSVALDLNQGAGANGNATCGPDGEIVLGRIIDAGLVVFIADIPPGTDFGVRATKTQSVTSLCTNLFSLPTVQFEISARTFAICDGSAPPRLIRVDQYVCDGIALDPCD